MVLFFQKYNHNDFIWELGRDKNNQINGAIEHLLYTITNVAYALQFQSWDWSNPSSDLNVAMQQAVDKGIYNITNYKDRLLHDGKGGSKSYND